MSVQTVFAQDLWAADFWAAEFWSDITRAKGRKKKRKFSIEVDNEIFVADTIDEAIQLLAQVRETAEETPAEIKLPRIRILTPSGQPTRSKALKKAIESTENAISKILRAKAEKLKAEIARDEEIAKLLRLKLQREEEEAVLMLLLS